MSLLIETLPFQCIFLYFNYFVCGFSSTSVFCYLLVCQDFCYMLPIHFLFAYLFSSICSKVVILTKMAVAVTPTIIVQNIFFQKSRCVNQAYYIRMNVHPPPHPFAPARTITTYCKLPKFATVLHYMSQQKIVAPDAHCSRKAI